MKPKSAGPMPGRNAPNSRSNPSRLDQYGRGMPATRDELHHEHSEPVDLQVSLDGREKGRGRVP